MLARSVFGLARIGQRFPVAIPSLVRPLSSVVAAPTTTSASGSEAATPRKKHKVPQKRYVHPSIPIFLVLPLFV